MRKYGLIGFPLEHSFSKDYFTDKFRNEGIKDAVYENYPLENISGFNPLYQNDPDLKGLNVTIPYKESVLPFLDVLSEDARNIKAVNTICLCTKTGRLAKVGHNTDVAGFRISLKENMEKKPEKAIVLGTGGASKAIVYVLEEMEIHVTLVSSSGKEGAISYKEVNKRLIEQSKLIVNTTPLGMYPKNETFPEIPYTAITPEHLLFDLVYNPRVSVFMKKGKEQAARAISGYDMLRYQAEAAWEIWNR